MDNVLVLACVHFIRHNKSLFCVADTTLFRDVAQMTSHVSRLALAAILVFSIAEHISGTFQCQWHFDISMT